MFQTLPNEISLIICQLLKNPKDIRNLALTNKNNYLLITHYFIKKEKWVNLSLKDNPKTIKNFIKIGYRFINYNNKIQYVYNFIHFYDRCQIMTQNETISAVKQIIPFESNYIKILINAPYNIKVKPLKNLT